MEKEEENIGLDEDEFRDQNPFGVINPQPPQNENKKKIIIGMSILVGVIIILIIILAAVSRGKKHKDENTWRSSILPSWQLPYEFGLTLNLNPSSDGYGGEVLVNLKYFNLSSNLIVMNSNNITITSCQIRVGNGASQFEGDYIDVDKLIEDKQNGYLLISSNLILNAPVIDEIKYIQLKLEFNSLYNHDQKGIYKLLHHRMNGDPIPIISTNFEPVYARDSFPCKKKKKTFKKKLFKKKLLKRF